jgi:hypothetical protein
LGKQSLLNYAAASPHESDRLPIFLSVALDELDKLPVLLVANTDAGDKTRGCGYAGRARILGWVKKQREREGGDEVRNTNLQCRSFF